MEALKLNNRLNIIVKDGQEEYFSFYSQLNNKNKNLESSFINTPSLLLSKFISGSSNFIEQLCNSYIKSKYIKMVKYKKITPTIYKLKEIYADL